MKIELGKMKSISDVTDGELCIVGLGKETVLALKLQNQIIPLSEHAGENRFHLTDFGDEAAFVPNNLVLSTTPTSIRSGHTGAGF